jgi:hypothetical protein
LLLPSEIRYSGSYISRRLFDGRLVHGLGTGILGPRSHEPVGT